MAICLMWSGMQKWQVVGKLTHVVGDLGADAEHVEGDCKENTNADHC